MIRPPPRFTRPGTLLPDTTPFRSDERSTPPSMSVRPSVSSELRPSARSKSSTSAAAGTAGSVVARLPAGSLTPPPWTRSEEHTSELQSLMRISYAVFCLKKTHRMSQHHTQHPPQTPPYEEHH